MSSQKDADPHAVEDYMDAFEDYSKNLLQRVVNLADVNVGSGGGCSSIVCLIPWQIGPCPFPYYMYPCPVNK